jgi:hypothetical protein
VLVLNAAVLVLNAAVLVLNAAVLVLVLSAAVLVIVIDRSIIRRVRLSDTIKFLRRPKPLVANAS